MHDNSLQAEAVRYGKEELEGGRAGGDGCGEDGIVAGYVGEGWWDVDGLVGVEEVVMLEESTGVRSPEPGQVGMLLRLLRLAEGEKERGVVTRAFKGIQSSLRHRMCKR